MALINIHQTIHGYRDGHRLLSSSISFNADASRLMLVLSDMSGPSMHPGFDEYFTGYPLPGSDVFVFAKTWSAPEMPRPGCVWTHSLLIPKEHISQINLSELAEKFQRPDRDRPESSAISSIAVEKRTNISNVNDIEESKASEILISVIFGQLNPVLIRVDGAAQVERLFFRIWEGLWSGARSRFSFCTGALQPRSISGTFLDLQAVPRSISPSLLRKSTKPVLLVDMEDVEVAKPWAAEVVRSNAQVGASFRSWIEALVGDDAKREIAPILAPIFGKLHQSNWDARTVLVEIIASTTLEMETKCHLFRLILDKKGSEDGPVERGKLLLEICRRFNDNYPPLVSLIDDQVHVLFVESRPEGYAFVRELLHAERTQVGEKILRGAVLLLRPSDLVFEEALVPFLPAMISTDPTFAVSPELWRGAGTYTDEILANLDLEKLSPDQRRSIVEAIIDFTQEPPIERLINIAGYFAISYILSAYATGTKSLSSRWQSILSLHEDEVLKWIEAKPAISVRELGIICRILNPLNNPKRLEKIWESGLTSAQIVAERRVMVFGFVVALAVDNLSDLMAACFQHTFDALADERVDSEEWSWICHVTSPISWWREWDRCERIVMAISHRLERHSATLDTVFRIAKSRLAVRKLVSALKGEKMGRSYLISLRRELAGSKLIGSREQREELSDSWLPKI